MNLLVVSPWFPRYANDVHGGFVLDSARALQQQGHRVSIAVLDIYRPRFMGRLHPDWQPVPVVAGDFDDLTVVRFSYPSLPRNLFRRFSNLLAGLFLSARLRRLIAAGDFDVIHVHNELPAELVLRTGTRLPVIMSLHGIDPAGYRQRAWFHRRFRWLVDRLSQVVFVGPSLRDHYERQYGRIDNATIIPNGIAPRPGMVQRHFDFSTEIRLVSVSNLHPNKGLAVNLAALAGVVEQTQASVSYTIVGDGEELADLKAQAEQLGISAQVRFAGHCSRDEVQGYLADADIFCLPSSPEAFGIAWLEAMQHGLITIAVSGEGPSTFIQDGENGFLLDSPGENELTSLLNRIISLSAETLDQLSDAAMRTANEDFQWRNHAAQLSQLCASVSRTT